MAITIFPTDTATATPVAADLVMIADVSDSNKPKDNTIENVVLAVVDDASTLATRIWSANKVNTALATKQASDATLTTLSGKSTTGTGDIILATSPTLITPVLGVASASSITIGGASGNTLVVDTSTLIVDATNDRVGVLTTAPTHSLTFGSASTGVSIYNTADQTTNFERARIQYVSNQFRITTGAGGSGSTRNIHIIANNNSTDADSTYTSILLTPSQITHTIRASPSQTIGSLLTHQGTGSTMSSGSYAFISLTPTIGHTSTAGYTALLTNVTESSTGSGSNKLFDFQVGSVTKISATNAGGLLNARVISANASTPVTVTAPDSNKVYTNEGATAKIVFNLPTAVAGYTYTFIVQDADGIDITAAAGDTIRRNTNITAAAGTVTSTAIGSILTLVAINVTEWIATSEVGTRS